MAYGFQSEEDLTTIRVVFEAHAGNYRAHTIDYQCQDEMDSNRMEFAQLLNYRRHTVQDFQHAVMTRLGEVGISGACVSFEPIEKTEYAHLASEGEGTIEAPAMQVA